MSFKAILKKVQNNWKVSDEMAKYASKYFEEYVNDKGRNESITLNSPVQRKDYGEPPC